MGLPRSMTSGVVNTFKRTLGLGLPPRAGKTIKGSKADIIRSMKAEGKTNQEIIQEGVRRDGDGWSYDYVYTVLNRE